MLIKALLRLDPIVSPRPVRPRRTNAAQTPSAAYSPATRSLIGRPERSGGSSGAPLTLMKPLIAWAMKSKAGRSRYGPAAAEAVDVHRSPRPGRSACSRASSKPIRASTPGRKFSTSTSAGDQPRQHLAALVRAAGPGAASACCG